MQGCISSFVGVEDRVPFLLKSSDRALHDSNPQSADPHILHHRRTLQIRAASVATRAADIYTRTFASDDPRSDIPQHGKRSGFYGWMGIRSSQHRLDTGVHVICWVVECSLLFAI